MKVTRLAGIVILIGAVFGLILSIYGLYALWTVKPTVSAGIVDMLQLSNRTLDATDSLLETMSNSLAQADRDLILMKNILSDTSSTIDQATHMVDDTANLMGTDMTQFVQNTQESLTATQSTAQLVDDMLGTISKLPFIGSRYTPKVPLSQSIQNVNQSLDPLSQSFKKYRSI